MKQHPLKQSCNGLPVVTVPLVLFSDDTSGNRSKKWNKFDYWSMTLAGLPIREARSFHNMYFLNCSNRLTALEIAPPIIEDVELLENGCVMHMIRFYNRKFWLFLRYLLYSLTMLGHLNC